VSKGFRNRPSPCSKTRRSLEPGEARHWLTHLRGARAKALADAEGFDAILFTLEGLGQFLCGEACKGLGDYEPALRWLACRPSADPLAIACVNGRFTTLFSMVRRVRNDAMHQGAIARNATTLCVELSLMLEDGLLAEASTLGDYMITSPIEAKMFESIGAIRRTMLMNSFSFLPVRMSDGVWKLVSDAALARYLRGLSNTERMKALAKSLQASETIELLDVQLRPAEASIESILAELDSRPVLVVRDVNGKPELVGLVTAFDLL